MTTHFDNYDHCARGIITTVGKKIIIGVPLGIGKPIGLLNALYRQACDDPSINLTIVTGLTLARPLIKNDLEKKFIEPILNRILKDYEDPLYEEARVLQKLPANINVIEFFLMPGKFLHNNYVQENYISSSYTTATRDVFNLSVNVLAQVVAPSKTNSNLYSLSSNTDLFHEMRQLMLKSAEDGNKIAIVAEVNSNLPFMYGATAEVDSSLFTHIVNTGNHRCLFSVPLEEITPQDHLIGLYTSSLIRDNGCLQIGIGGLSNSLANALIFRNKENAAYRHLLNQLNIQQKFGESIAKVGSFDTFDKGLYASTEMFSDGYMQLYKESILKKMVYDHVDLPGKILHAGFFLGSANFYSELHHLPDEERRLFEMTSIARTNSLLWSPELLTLQRQDARFVNSSLMVTLLGDVVSDGLNNYQELSGVGGQHDFVLMANQLSDGRSIINCRSTRKTKGTVESNIVWNYTNSTIPRYLRDFIVTEYGIADCRGKTDADVIKAILNIADSRFQPNLLNIAKKSGKLPNSYEIPELFRHNYPKTIEKIIHGATQQGYCQPYPFGSDLTNNEQILARTLSYLKNTSKIKLFLFTIASLFYFRDNANINSCLHRMDLKYPKNPKEYIYKKLLSYVIHLNR